MPPLVRSGDAGKREPQGARAIAKGMLGQMTAPLDPVLPFDDAWIQEIKVCTDLAQEFCLLVYYDKAAVDTNSHLLLPGRQKRVWAARGENGWRIRGAGAQPCHG
jgi:hypothetical protein